MFSMPYSRKSIELDEVELLEIDNMYNSQNVLLSTESGDRDDTLSVVCASRAGSSNSVFNLRSDKRNSRPKYNSIEPSTNNCIGTTSVKNSTNVAFGTIFAETVTIENCIDDRTDTQQNLNLQHNEHSDPSSETRTKISFGGKRWTFRSLFLLILASVTMLTTALITAGYYVGYVGNIPPNTVSTTTIAFDDKDDYESIKTNHYKPTEASFKDGYYEFIERKSYGALPPIAVDEPLTLPIKRIIIAHTATSICTDYSTCAARLLQMQEYHMKNGFDDIKYNFVIGGDGRAYEGRGYTVGACTNYYNNGSVCIAFIGNFNLVEASEKQLGAAHRLINDGIKMRKIHPNYALYGHSQLSDTASPGTLLYNQIKLWSQWSEEIIDKSKA